MSKGDAYKPKRMFDKKNTDNNHFVEGGGVYILCLPYYKSKIMILPNITSSP